MAIEIKNDRGQTLDTGTEAPSLDTASAVKFELPIGEEARLQHLESGGAVLKRGNIEVLVAAEESVSGVGLQMGRPRYNPAPDTDQGGIPVQRGGATIVHTSREIEIKAAA